jgi:hypothetical protein
LLLVIADTSQSARQNLGALAGARDLNLPEQNETEEGVRLKAVVDWLNGNPDWLLILDNVDTPDALAEVDRLMGRLAGGRVLLTGRLDRFARQVEPLELDVLAPNAAATFLLEATDTRRHKAPDDDAAASRLAEEMGRLALALEQAAATIDKLRCGFRRYLEIWQSNREKAAGRAKPEITGYHHAVAATWQTSVDQLNEAGRNLLERLAFFAPDPVPLYLLDVAIPRAEAEDLHEALADLAGVSLVTQEIESERFTVHPLVQDVTLRSLGSPLLRRRLAEVHGWVNAVCYNYPGAVHSWPGYEQFFPHVRNVNQWAAAEREADRIAASLGLAVPGHTPDAPRSSRRRSKPRAGSSRRRG